MTKPIRKKLNITQQQLATLLGVSRRIVLMWEKKQSTAETASELQIGYLAKRDCKIHVMRKDAEADESTGCDYCLSSILVSNPALYVNGKKYDRVLCAVMDELKL